MFYKVPTKWISLGTLYARLAKSSTQNFITICLELLKDDKEIYNTKFICKKLPTKSFEAAVRCVTFCMLFLLASIIMYIIIFLCSCVDSEMTTDQTHAEKYDSTEVKLYLENNTSEPTKLAFFFPAIKKYLSSEAPGKRC